MHKSMLSFRNHALSEFQFGFRPNYSTSLACTCFIIKYFSANKLAITAFLDLSKAFDTLDHRILLNKLPTEVGTNNIISKAQRYKAQRSFQPAKAQRKMRNLIFLLSEAQRNFRNKLFDSVEAQRNSAIAERYFRTKLKRNLTSAIEISQHNANTAFFAILD